eukprot:370931-Rhodomonas_salina.3
MPHQRGAVDLPTCLMWDARVGRSGLTSDMVLSIDRRRQLYRAFHPIPLLHWLVRTEQPSSWPALG